MYNGNVEKISKFNKGGYLVECSVDYQGVEEYVTFRYSKLQDLPRFLFWVEDGHLKYKRGQPVLLSNPFEDANGLVFEALYEFKN